MKLSFESPQGVTLGDYQSIILQCRDEATRVWHQNCQAFTNQVWFNASAPPAFFIDRCGFRHWLSSVSGVVSSEYISIPEIDFRELFESYDDTVRKSIVGSKVLGTGAPHVDECVRRSQFLDDCFSDWQQHLARHGINLPTETIDWYFSVPLHEVYRNSVFYPRHPVLWGPNYYGRIAGSDREHILSHYGDGAVWDFYFLMMVCHEQSHLMQKGEPILNEIAHAILWIDFVLERGLKPFQVNSATGKTCNIEAPYILDRVESLRGVDFHLLFEDNMKYFDQEVTVCQYSHFVALTFLVHAGVLRYRYLTNLFCGLLAGDVDVKRYLQSGVSDHLALILAAVLDRNEKTALRDLVRSHMPSFGVIHP